MLELSSRGLSINRTAVKHSGFLDRRLRIRRIVRRVL